MKTLTLNYIMVVWAWCLYLNHHFVSSILLLMAACVCLTNRSRKFNYLRMILVFSLSFLALNILYSLTTLQVFFSNFEYFATMLCLNFSKTNEIVHTTKKDNLSKILKIILSLCVLFNLITLILPNEWYLIFTKTNIYVLIAFIFLPDVISVSVSLAVKEFNMRYQLV